MVVVYHAQRPPPDEERRLAMRELLRHAGEGERDRPQAIDQRIGIGFHGLHSRARRRPRRLVRRRLAGGSKNDFTAAEAGGGPAGGPPARPLISSARS